MDEKTLKLLERAIQENLTPESVAYIMKYNGYDQSVIDSAVEELKKKRAAATPQQPSTSEAQMGSGESPSAGNQNQGQDGLPSGLPTPVSVPPRLQAYFTQQARGLVPMAGLNDEVTTPEQRVKEKEEWDRKVAAGEVREPGGSVLLRHFAEEDRREARDVRNILDDADAEPTVMLPGMVMTPETMERGQAELNQQQNEKRRKANEELSAKLGTQVTAYEDDGTGNMVAAPQHEKLREYSVGLSAQAEYRINEFIVDEAKAKAQIDPILFGATGNLLTSFGDVVTKTAGMMMETTGIIDEEAADYGYEQMRQRRMNRYYSAVNNPEMGISESIQNGEFENAFQQILFAGSDFIPQVITTIANPTLGIAYGGASASSSTYDEYRNRMDLTPEEKVILVGGAAVIETVAEKLGIGDIKMARKFLGIAADEVGTSVARKKALSFLTPITKGFAPEFAEEFGVSVANQALAMTIAGEDFSWRDAFDEGLIGGVFGSTTVGVPQVLAAGANGMASRGRMKQFKDVANQISAIQDALVNPEITDTERALLKEELVRLGIEQAKITQTSVKDYEAMAEDDQKQLVEVHSEINKAVELYENAKDKTAKSLALRSVKRALDLKAEIESRYDSKTQTGLRGTQQEGQDTRTVPQPGTGTETSPADRVVQAPQTEVDPVFHSPKFEVDGQGRPIAQDPAKSDKEVFTAGGVRETSKLDAENASALNKIFGVTAQIAKNAKLVVHHNLQSLINENGKAIAVYLKKGSTPMAYYIPSKDGKAAEFHVLSQQAYDKYNEATGRQIDANKTYAHEMVHPIISAMLQLDPEVESGLYKQLEMLAEGGNEIAKAAIAFGAKYTRAGRANKVQNESVTEFFALMADPARFDTLDRTFKQKVMKMFNELLARLGFDIKVTTDQDLIMMASNIHSAIKLGAEIALPQSNKSYQKRSLDFSLEEETKPAGSRLFNEPLEGVQDIVQKYVQKAGIDYRPGKNINTIDTDRAKRIGEAYDRMEHNPSDPAVKKSYEALAKETVAQYEAILEAGYEIEINNAEPYANSAEMISDLRDNNRMKIFSTESGFGDTPITDQQRAENPMLRDSGFKDVNGQPLLVNDVFRFVHDFFGHAERGNSFGAKGEENAWDAHSRMYSPEARKAMTTETRGQNSWVNFSGVNDAAFKLRDKARALRKQGKTDEAAAVVEQVYETMRFADQKVGLLPDEFVQNDYDGIEFSLEQSFVIREGEEVKFKNTNPAMAKVREVVWAERVLEENPMFNFTGTEKIESAADVAYLFRHLESAVSENAFIVFSNPSNGEYRVQWLGTGGTTSQVIDAKQIAAAYQNVSEQLGSDRLEVTLVHNHPSGRLQPSAADITVLGRIQTALSSFGATVLDGVIINLDSGKFSTFSDRDKYGNVYRTKTTDTPVPYAVQSFSRQELYASSSSRMSIRSPQDVAIALSRLKRGVNEKLGYFVLNQANEIAYSAILDPNESISRKVSAAVADVGRYGETLIIFGNDALAGKQLAAELKEPISAIDKQVLDVIAITNTDSGILEARAQDGSTLREDIVGDIDFSLEDVKGTEKIKPGKVANTVINKSKRTETKSLSVNDINYGSMSTVAQPVGLSKKILSGSFSYKKKGKTISLPIGIKNTARLNKINRITAKIRLATGSEKTALKKALGTEVEAAMMDIKEFMKANIRVLFNSLTPDFVDKSKQWYDGANRIAQQFAKDYKVSLEQAAGILAALSPQNDWFNNITNANHVMDVMIKERNTSLDDGIIAAAVEYSNSKSTKPGDSEFSQRLKDLYAEIGNVSIADLESLEQSNNADYGIAKANILRAISLAKMSQENKTIDPEGNVVGTYDMPHTWMTDAVIVNAINIFTDGSPEVISASLGDGNKVRNFYNNIVDPNSAEEYLTADTHALAVALGSPISAADAGGFGLFGGNESITYAIIKDAYIEVANEVGLLPRQLQSVTWEAVRTGVNNPSRPKKKETLKLIQQLSNSDLSYEERAIEIIKLNPSFTPEWAVKRGITAQEDASGLRPTDQKALDTGDGGVPPSRREGLGGVRGRDSRMGQDVAGEVDFAIDWYESPEGKGDPAISRRDTQLEEAAQDLLAGRIKNYEFREMAKGLSPIEPITQFFAPATQERMASALSKDKVKSLNAPVKEGQVVALRLDIPAYTSSNTWVVSLHDGLKRDGKVVSYRNVARITDVVFKSNPLAALNIAAGEAKSTIGRMFGKYKSFNGATVEEQAESAKSMVNEIWKDRSWKQIGMNPTRASYFYDRASGRPVLSAEEVVQIGGLVYAKNPVYTKWNDPAFQVSGYNDVDGSPIYFSLDDSNPDASNLRRTVTRTLGRFSDETRARILANPKAYMTPQSINTVKDNLALLSDDELVENMTAEALQMVANTANPGKGENDISVLAAVELLNRKTANGEDVSELLVNLAQLGTTVGRMLRHFAELKSSTPMGIVETVRSVLKKADRLMTSTQETRLTDIAQRFIDAQRKVTDLRDQLIEQFDPAAEAELQKATKDLDKVTRELNKFTSLIIPKKTQDLLTTTIQGNLLTPISQVTNVVANLWQIALSIPVRSFETLGSSLYALFGGQKFRSFPASITALPYAMKQAGVGIGEALTTIIKGGATTEKIVHSGFVPAAAFLAALSDTRFAQAVNAAFGKDVIKGDVLPRLANGKIAASDRAKALYEGMFGVAPEVMFRFLALGDKPFYRFAEAMQLAQEADKLGLKGEARRTFLKYPSKKAAKAADDAGKRLTFQQDSQAASAVFQVMKTLGRIPGVGKALEFMLKVSLPYVKTPANIFTETMAFAIPGFGFARGAQRIWTGKTQDGISDMAKAATGQMIIMAANQLIAQGLIQGAFTDEDDEERALKYLQQPPMTVNIDGLIRLLNGEDPAWQPTDRVRRYDKLGIVGMVMGARVTAVKNNLSKSKDKEEGYYVGEEKSFFEPFTYVWDQLGVPLATFQTLNQQSFLAGSSSLLKVLSGGASERDVEDWFESTFRALTAVPFPNTLSAIHRGMREYMPSIKTKNPLTKFKYVVMDRLFMTDGIPARVDAFGEKIPQTPEGANRWIYNLADPTKAQETTGDPLWAEIYRVYSLNEESKVIPGFPSKLTQLPTKNPLNSKPITGWNAEKEEKWLLEMERLQVSYGKEQREIVNDLVSSDYYNASSNEDKEAMLIEVLDAYQSGRKPTLKAPVSGLPSIKRKQAWLKEYEDVVEQFFQ